MAATIQIHEMSALATGTNKTSGTIRYKMADNSTVDENNRMVILESGTSYSYTKKVRAYIEAPCTTELSNIRWYTDGSNTYGTGVAVVCKNIGTTWGANYATQMADGTNIFTFTSAAPLDGDYTDTGPWDSGDDNMYIGDLIELQMSVADTASPGTLSGETLTLVYDEI